MSNLTGMGINFHLGEIFPTVDYSALAFQQLTLLTDMVARFQDEVRGEFGNHAAPREHEAELRRAHGSAPR